jgi:hypothetical protein
LKGGGSIFFRNVARGWQGAASGPEGVTVDQLFAYVRRETLAQSQSQPGLDKQAPVRRGDEAIKLVLNDSPVRAPVPEVTRDTPQALEGQYGAVLSVRRLNERQFEKATGKVPVQVYRDDQTQMVVYLSRTGAIALAAATAAIPPADKSELSHLGGLRLQARKVGEADFSNATRTWTVEVFRDETAGNLVYVAESGAIAVVPVPPPSAPSKRNVWKHGFELQVRRAGEGRFGAATRKFSIEIYEHGSTGNLIFLGENGALVVVPGPEKPGDKDEPEWRHRYELDLPRGADADARTAPRIGVEAYFDRFSKRLLFVTQDGSLAVGGPGNAGPDRPNEPPTPPVRLRRLSLKGPKPPVEEFRPAFGVELYRDPRSGSVLGVAETGNVSATDAKKE